MAIIFPDETYAVERGVLASTTYAEVGSRMTMLSTVMDLNGVKNILINDGSNDRILIGYQSGGF